MTRAALDRYLFRFDKEPTLQAARAEGDLAGYDLDADERRVVMDGDLATLLEWGVHPLLIRNFGAVIGIKYIDAYAARGWMP